MTLRLLLVAARRTTTVVRGRESLRSVGRRARAGRKSAAAADNDGLRAVVGRAVLLGRDHVVEGLAAREERQLVLMVSVRRLTHSGNVEKSV